MARFNQDYFEKVTRAVEEAEEKTSAELVVAIHPQSGTYRDVDFLFAALAAFVGLLFIVFNPWTVHSALLIPFEVALLFVIGALASATWPRIRRRLCRAKRRECQVRSAAAAMFFEEGVANTRDRTGVLVFLSRLEGQVEVIADIGVVRTVKPEQWGPCVFALQKIGSASDVAAALLEGIARLGEVLSEDLPPGEDNPDEIPNRPRTTE